MSAAKGTRRKGRSETSGGPQAQNGATGLEHRKRIEDAVAEISLLLTSGGLVDYGQILSMLGKSTGAEVVYLQRVPPDNRPIEAIEEDLGAVEVSFWSREDGPAGNGGPSSDVVSDGRVWHFGPGDDEPGRLTEELLREKEVQAVPILSSGGRFHGYLGLAHSKGTSTLGDTTRILNVVGDLLGSFFERRRAEEALHESEERWRTLVEKHPEPIVLTTDRAIVYANPAAYQLFGASSADHVLQRSLFDFISADEQGAVEASLKATMQGEAPPPIQHEISRLDGEWRIIESFAVPVTLDGRPAAQMVLRDITERKKSEERYRTFVETISEGIWHVRLMEPIATTANPALQAQHIEEIGVLAECNRAMAHILGASSPSEVIGGSFWVLQAKTGFGENLVRSDYRVHGWEASHVDQSGRERHFTFNASGIVERGQFVGIWGSCVDTTENVELERRMVNALEEQQQQIGRELHDGVGQLLTGVRMLSQVLVESYPSSDAESDVLARKIMKFAEEASQQVRNIYYGLTPAQLSAEGLASALEELVVNTDAIPNIRCTFSYDGRTDVTDLQTKLHLYRIAQEAINNALKHSQANKIEVLFRSNGADIEVSVADNGIGFDPGRKKTKSLGIKSMHYRARAIRAKMEVLDVPEGGTLVRCTLPLGPAATVGAQRI